MRTRHLVPAFLALVFALVLSLCGYARAVTYAGQPLAGTATVTSLAVCTATQTGAQTPVLFLAGNSNVNTAIQGGVFWSDTTCVLVLQDGSGGPAIGTLGITASTPLPITPTHLGLGSPGQTGSGICTSTKGNGIYATVGSSPGSVIHVSFTGPVNQQ